MIVSEAFHAITLVLSELTVGCQSPQHDREVFYMIMWHLFSGYVSLSVYPDERIWSAEIERALRDDQAQLEGGGGFSKLRRADRAQLEYT